MAPDAMLPQTQGWNRWAAPVGLAFLLGGLFFFRLGQDVPLRSHEALLAVSARNMFLDQEVHLADGTHPSAYMVPNFDGVPRLRKTPLPYWEVAGLAYLTGTVDEWTARFPSALAALGTVLILMGLLRRTGDRQTAFVGGAVLATTLGFVLFGRMALADMTMTFFTTASLAAVWMGVETGGQRRFRWFVLAGVAAGFAMLAKGPAPLLVFPAPYLVAGGIVLSRLRHPRRPEEGGRAEWGWTLGGVAAAALVCLGIMVPWPLYAYLRAPQALTIWETESLSRAIGEYGHEEPVYFYLTRLPMFLPPWTLFFFAGLTLAAYRAWRKAADRPWLLFLGAWLVGPLALFSLSVGKQDHYLLPILPAAAVYTAMAMRHLLGPTSDRAEKTGRRLLIFHGVAAILLGLVAVAAYVIFRETPSLLADCGLPRPFVTPVVFGPAAVLGGLGILGGLATWVLAAGRRPLAGLAVLMGTFASVFLLAWMTLMGPMDRSLTAENFARHVRQAVPSDAPLFAFDGGNATMIFYVERSLPELASPQGIQDKINQGHLFFLAVDAKHLSLLRNVSGLVPLFHEVDPYRPDEGFWLLRADGESGRPAPN